MPSIQWLLEQSLLKGAEPLTTPIHLEKEILGVSILEKWGDECWLRKGDFVLTSNIFLSSVSQNNPPILQSLLSHQCAALGLQIPLTTDISSIPFLKEMESCGIPVIRVPYSCSVGGLCNLIYREICLEEQEDDQRLARAYRMIAETVVQSHDLKRLVNSIASVIGMPVFLTDEQFHVLEYDVGEDSTCLPQKVHGFSIFDSSDIHFLKTRYQEQPYRQISHTTFTEGEHQNYILFPIEDHAHLVGYLCLREKEVSLTKSNSQFIQSCLSIIAMELSWHKIRQKKPKEKWSGFVENVLLNPTATPSDNDIQCHFYGFDTITPRLCFVIQLDNFTNCTIHQRKRTEAMMWEAVDKGIEGTGIKTFRLSYCQSMILFLFKDTFEIQSSALQTGKEIASKVLKLLGSTDVRCHIGISKAYTGSNTIKRCFDQSLQALELGNRLHPEWSIYSYRDDDVYHFLLDHLSPEQLGKFYSETIKPLVEYEKKYNSDLLSTLHLYYECGQSLSRTAKKLYIHRNTMLYRLDKIEKILDVDLRKTNESFRTQLALYIMHLIQHLNE